MTTLDKASVQLLQREIEEALKAVAAKHGVNIRYGGGTYNATNATLKLEVSVISANGQVVDKYVADLQKAGILYGFKPEHAGQSFKIGGETLTLYGLDRKSYKYPVLAKAANGKIFKYPLDVVQRAMGLKQNDGDFGVDVGFGR